MPEREGITRVEAAVAELVQAAQRDRAEVGELAHPAEVEERVAAERRDPPERDARCETEREHAESPGRDADRHLPQRERGRCETGSAEHSQREPDRAVQCEHQCHPGEERGEAPHERRREAVEPQRPGDQRPRQQQARRRRREPQPEPRAGRGHEPREPEQRRRREPPGQGEHRGPPQAQFGSDDAHLRSSLAAWTSAGLRSSRAKTAST